MSLGALGFTSAQDLQNDIVGTSTQSPIDGICSCDWLRSSAQKSTYWLLWADVQSVNRNHPKESVPNGPSQLLLKQLSIYLDDALVHNVTRLKAQ